MLLKSMFSGGAPCRMRRRAIPGVIRLKVDGDVDIMHAAGKTLDGRHDNGNCHFSRSAATVLNPLNGILFAPLLG